MITALLLSRLLFFLVSTMTLERARSDSNVGHTDRKSDRLLESL